MTTPEQLTERLTEFLQRSHDARSVRVEGLRLLTGGASRQTWSFDAVIEDPEGASDTLGLVLRADTRGGGLTQGGLDLEYRLLKAAGEAGVPVPKMHLPGDDSLGAPFFIMERVDGETIPRRLLRDDAYTEARRSMTGQLGAILAKIHRIPIDDDSLDGLPAPQSGDSPAETEVSRYEQVFRAMTPDPHPAFEFAFRWLRQHLPADPQPPDGGPQAGARRAPSGRVLVHGDYRLGNVIFGPDGARAILDWELAHIGDPMEDLGWISVRSWRFGNADLAVGGIGTREEFWRAYEEAGGAPVDAERVRFWEAFGNLRWGVSCIVQAKTYLDGRSSSVELASIGRRIAETEWELLELMEER